MNTDGTSYIGLALKVICRWYISRHLIEPISSRFMNLLKCMKLSLTKGFLQLQQVVKSLVQHRADVQSVDGYGRTSLHWSCKVANMDVSVFLIEHGADVMAVDWGMRTPLHWVCGGGLLQVQSRQLLAFTTD